MLKLLNFSKSTPMIASAFFANSEYSAKCPISMTVWVAATGPNRISGNSACSHDQVTSGKPKRQLCPRLYRKRHAALLVSLVNFANRPLPSALGLLGASTDRLGRKCHGQDLRCDTQRNSEFHGGTSFGAARKLVDLAIYLNPCERRPMTHAHHTLSRCNLTTCSPVSNSSPSLSGHV